MKLVAPLILALVGGYAISIGASPIIALSPFISSVVILQILKRIERNKGPGRIERELPATINRIINLHESGASFVEILERLADEKNETGKVFKRVLKEINSGVPVPLALEDSKRDVQSEDYSKCINKMIMFYRFGGTLEPLRKLAGELLEKRKIEMKRFSSKSLMYSLMLVSGSSVFPAMFLAYLIVGSMFMDVNLTPIDALFLPIFVFPSIDTLIIAFIESKRPRFA